MSWFVSFFTNLIHTPFSKLLLKLQVLTSLSRWREFLAPVAGYTELRMAAGSGLMRRLIRMMETQGSEFVTSIYTLYYLGISQHLWYHVDRYLKWSPLLGLIHVYEAFMPIITFFIFCYLNAFVDMLYFYIWNSHVTVYNSESLRNVQLNWRRLRYFKLKRDVLRAVGKGDEGGGGGG